MERHNDEWKYLYSKLKAELAEVTKELSEAKESEDYQKFQALKIACDNFNKENKQIFKLLEDAERERDSLKAKYNKAMQDWSVDAIHKTEIIVMHEEWKKKALEVIGFYGDGMNYSIDDYRGVSGEQIQRVVLYKDAEDINDYMSYAGKRARAFLEGER